MDTAQVTITIYDVEGHVVDSLINRIMSPGVHRVEWAAEGLPSGIYFYRITIGDSSVTRKMVLMK